jgi:hypothetical protein
MVPKSRQLPRTERRSRFYVHRFEQVAIPVPVVIASKLSDGCQFRNDFEAMATGTGITRFTKGLLTPVRDL